MSNFIMRRIISTLSTKIIRTQVGTMAMLPALPHPDTVYFTDTKKTFELQSKLPSLPVPNFDEALAMYIESVKPHVSEAEHRHTVKLAHEFRTGLGKHLYKKLKKKGQTQANWLSEWWDQSAYLSARTPNAPLINTNGPDRTNMLYWPPKRGSQVKRAAFVLHYMCRFWSNLVRERLKVDTSKSGDTLCMNQYTRFLNACRIPGYTTDTMEFYFKTKSEGPCPDHIIVIRKGHFFSVHVTTEDDDLLTAPELELQLQKVKDMADELCPAAGVGALTADQRSEWAEMRDKLMIHPTNCVILEKIQRSIAIIVLEDVNVLSEQQMCYVGLGGDPKNRWFDKPISVIVSENGLFNSNCDHTACEGVVLGNMMVYIDMWLMRQKGVWTGSTKIRELPPPTHLQILVNAEIQNRIAISRYNFTQTAKTVEIVIKDFTEYGRVYLRGFSVHVDTHIQMALQYTYYRLYKKHPPTYETGTTRRFYHGRTETIRSCTVEACDFAKAMCNPTIKSADKYKLYNIACGKHLWLLQECQVGKGCDRFLLGLILQSVEENWPLHEFFLDPSQVKSGSGGNFVLSTSFMGYTNNFGGCAPMVENGYGAFYKVDDNRRVITKRLSDDDQNRKTTV